MTLLKYKNHISIKSMAMEDRPREKFLQYGRTYLSDAELLAILIGTGSKKVSALDVARQLLDMYSNNLEMFGNSTIKELQSVKGVGLAKAITISAALELGVRRQYYVAEEKPLISSSRAAFNLIAPYLLHKNKEELWVLFLNRSNRLTGRKKLSEGGVSSTIIDPKIIFYEAINAGCSGFILAHNHPSGNLNPSDADITNTKKISSLSKMMEISFFDHIIVAGDTYYSFSDNGYM